MGGHLHYGVQGVGVPSTYMTDPDLCSEKQKENNKTRGRNYSGETQSLDIAYLNVHCIFIMSW